LDPRQSIPNKWETYTLNVPTETDVPTVQVRLLVPREFEIEMLEHSQAWQITRARDERGYIREVTWSGSSIPPQTFAELKLLVRNPATPGTYVWKIEQSYQDGTVATWEAQTQIVPAATVGGAPSAGRTVMAPGFWLHSCRSWPPSLAWACCCSLAVACCASSSGESQGSFFSPTPTAGSCSANWSCTCSSCSMGC